MSAADVGLRALRYGLNLQRVGNLRLASVARAVMLSADARRGAAYSRAWARIVAGRVRYIEDPAQRARARRHRSLDTGALRP